MHKALSVIIPAYNEEGRIAKTLLEVAGYLRAKSYDFEILVIHDGSTDNTAAEVRSAAAQCPEIKFIEHSENEGKGFRVKEGIRLARHPYCIFMDADNATTIKEWDAFERLFENGAKAIAASRHLPGAHIVHPQPWIRQFLGTGYRALCRMLFGLQVSDFNCGYKAYETALAREVYQEVTMRDWTFDVEVFCLLKKRGVVVAETPVQWSHTQKNVDRSLWGPIKTAFRTLGSIAALKRKY